MKVAVGCGESPATYNNGQGDMDKVIVKRTADWLEKMSVAAMAVGIFQFNFYGLGLGIACYIGSLYLSKKTAGE